jgi:hypothetical protein
MRKAMDARAAWIAGRSRQGRRRFRTRAALKINKGKCRQFTVWAHFLRYKGDCGFIRTSGGDCQAACENKFQSPLNRKKPGFPGLRYRSGPSQEAWTSSILCPLERTQDTTNPAAVARFAPPAIPCAAFGQAANLRTQIRKTILRTTPSPHF